MKHRAGDECRLVGDPEMLHGLIRVDIDDALRWSELNMRNDVCSHLGSQTCLKDRSVLLGPFLCNSGMVRPQLNQVSEKRYTRNLGDTLDLWLISRIGQLVQHVQADENSEVDNLIRHGCSWRSSPSGGKMTLCVAMTW